MTDTPASAMKTTSPLVGLVSGSAGAVTLVYVGQPLDTIKVRMQLSRAVTTGGGVSMWSCVRDMWRQALVVPPSRLNNAAVVSGAAVEACSLSSTGQQTNRLAAAARMTRLLYAGTAPALLANVAENGVLFAAYGPCQRLMAFLLDLSGAGGSGPTAEDVEKKLGPTGMAAAGSLASLCSAFALCPTELIKVRLQAADLERSKTTKASGKAAGTLQVVANVWKTEGGLRGMYRGMGSTVAREMPGYYVFFLAYEASRTHLSAWSTTLPSASTVAEAGVVGGHGATSSGEDPTWVTMTAGAAAGMCLWLVVYPVDAIKSRIQATGGGGGGGSGCSTEKSTCKSGGFFNTLVLSLRHEGPMALYRGLAPTLLRTVPASAVMFWTVERTKTLLSSYGL